MKLLREPTAFEVPKQYRPFLVAAKKAGWKITRTRTGHVRLTRPDGSWSMPLPCNPSSTNLAKSIASKLRKEGLDV